MKKFYLYNLFLLLFAMIMFLFFRNQGYFISLIMSNDIINYAAVFPTFLCVGVFGIVYQLSAIRNNDKFLIEKIAGILVAIYISLILILETRIYVTVGDGLLIVLLAIPIAFIIMNIISINIRIKRV